MSTSVSAPTIIDIARPQGRDRLWDVGLVVTFASFMAALAQISIPLPFTPVPLTGQTFGVLLTGALLGSRRAGLALLLYLAEGTAGLPVFALGHSGPLALFGPTGGYLVACPIGAYVVGSLAEHGWDRSLPSCFIAMLAGDVVIFAVGMAWLSHFVGASQVVALGLTPFIPGDVAKILLAAVLLPTGWRVVRGMNQL